MDESEIVLGEEYKDTLSGFTGIAVARTEYIHGCTRVALQRLEGGDLKEWWFDAPAIQSTKKPEPITSSRTGGDRPAPPARSAGR